VLLYTPLELKFHRPIIYFPVATFFLAVYPGSVLKDKIYPSYLSFCLLMMRVTFLTILPSFLVLAPLRARGVDTLPPPGQPLRRGTIGGFEIIGSSLVSGQQVCPLKCYIVIA